MRLHIYELIETVEKPTEEEADEIILQKVKEGYNVEFEKYWREYFYVYSVKVYKKQGE